jgi:hypothetical protein
MGDQHSQRKCQSETWSAPSLSPPPLAHTARMADHHRLFTCCCALSELTPLLPV